jgi:hypothetical protein
MYDMEAMRIRGGELSYLDDMLHVFGPMHKVAAKIGVSGAGRVTRRQLLREGSRGTLAFLLATLIPFRPLICQSDRTHSWSTEHQPANDLELERILAQLERNTLYCF